MKCKYCGKEFECSRETFPWCRHPMANECICLECICNILSHEKRYLTSYDCRTIISRLIKCFPHKRNLIDKVARELLVELL